jgi:hypothetical protein
MASFSQVRGRGFYPFFPAGAKTNRAPEGAVQVWEVPLFLQLPLEDFDLLGKRHVVADQALDLAHRVQHRGVVAAAEPPADFRL